MAMDVNYVLIKIAEFVSKKYIGMNVKLKVKCNKCEYEWKSAPSNIKNNKGCPKCARNIKIDETDFIKKLNKKNIQLLEKYNGLSGKYSFSCFVCGNIWKTSAVVIWNKSGCPRCSKANKFINIQNLDNLAKERNLKLLSKKCLGRKELHEWECLGCGRKYKIKPYNVRSGTSCRTCKLRSRKGGN